MFNRLRLLKIVANLNKNPFFKYYHQLHINQFLKKTELENQQIIKLKKLLSYASQNIPFYKKRFANLNLDKIRDLPVLSKEELKNAKSEIITSKKRLIKKTTSGTTGPAFNFYINKDLFALEIAKNLRIFDMVDFEIGEPWVLLVPLRDRKNFLFSKLINRLVLDAALLSFSRTPLCCPKSKEEKFKPNEQVIQMFFRKILKHQPKLIYSYPSTLIVLATYIKKWNIKGIHPTKIITSGEILTHPARKFIEEIFQSEIFDLYGTTEFPAIAQECKEHNGLHVFIDSYFVESLENQEIIVTDLENYIMPFIRYQTGDFGVLKKDICKCGRPFPLMEITYGRVSDLIVTSNGQFLRASFFASLVKKNQEVRQFQIVQEKPEHLVIYIATKKSLSDSRKDLLFKRSQAYAGDSIDITIEFVSDAVLDEAKHRELKQFFQTYPVLANK
ncbi:MAG: hypothetical protein ABIK61_06200 [candidate division WOR-3 bacterium]